VIKTDSKESDQVALLCIFVLRYFIALLVILCDGAAYVLAILCDKSNVPCC